MAAGTLNLTAERAIEAGSTYYLLVQLYDQGGDPLDLTEFDFAAVGSPADGIRCQFRATADDGSLTIDQSDTDNPPAFDLDRTASYPATGAQILDPPTSGQIALSISFTDTLAAQADTSSPFAPATPQLLQGKFDAVGVGKDTATGTVYRMRLLGGDWTLSKGITRF